MTVTTIDNVKQATGNGVTTVFAFTFLVLEVGDINVYLDDVLQSSGYVVSLNTPPTAGGDVTFSAAPASGVTVTVERLVTEDQQTDYTPYDKFPAETHERALDKLTMITQQLQDEINRCLRFPVTAPSVSSTDNAAVRWDGITGALVQDSGVIIDDSDNITGVAALTTSGLTTLANVDINGGAIDGTMIGFSTPAAGVFSSIASSGLAVLPSVDIGGGAINGTTIGASWASSGKFITLEATGSLGITTNNVLMGGVTTGALTVPLIGVNASDKVSIDSYGYGAVFGGTITTSNAIIAGDIYGSSVNIGGLAGSAILNMTPVTGEQWVVDAATSSTLAISANTVTGDFIKLTVATQKLIEFNPDMEDIDFIWSNSAQDNAATFSGLNDTYTFKSAISARPNFYLRNTSAGGVGASLWFYKTSASPGVDDELGAVKSSGYDSGGATVDYFTEHAHVATGVTPGAVTGAHLFKAAIAGVMTEIAKFDGAGTIRFNGNSESISTTVYNANGAFATFSGTTDNFTIVSEVSGQPRLTVRQDGDNNLGGSLRFQNNRATPNVASQAGRVEGLVQNDADTAVKVETMRFEVNDITDGQEAGRIEFEVAQNGSDVIMLTLEGEGGGTSGGTVTVNDAGQDVDFRVESAVSQYGFWMRGDDGYVGMNEASPDTALHIKDSVDDYAPAITLESTYSGTKSGSFEFVKNAATMTVNDYLGRITFGGDDAGGSSRNYCSIEAIVRDTTAALQEGLIRIRNRVAGVAKSMISAYPDKVIINEDNADVDFIVESTTAESFKVAADGGVHASALKSGTTQVGAGAAADELWHDTTDDTIKLGV